MNNNNGIYGYLEKDYIPRPETCIHHKCWECDNLDYKDGHAFCVDFSCPLWLYRPDDCPDGADDRNGKNIYIIMCRKIHENK